MGFCFFRHVSLVVFSFFFVRCGRSVFGCVWRVLDFFLCVVGMLCGFGAWFVVFFTKGSLLGPILGFQGILEKA